MTEDFPGKSEIDTSSDSLTNKEENNYLTEFNIECFSYDGSSSSNFSNSYSECKNSDFSSKSNSHGPSRLVGGGVVHDRGCQRRFWWVWRQHEDFLFRRCLALMAGNFADAEDALSEAMLRAARKFAKYSETIRNERAWLARLTHNICIDRYRDAKRRARLLAEFGSSEVGVATGRTTRAVAMTPEDLLIAKQDFAALERDIMELPEKLREPLMLRSLDDVPYAEIAEQIGLSPAAARKRVQLARTRLRERATG